MTYFIPGMQPSTGEQPTAPSSRPWPTKEQLEKRHPKFYKNRPEHMTSPMGEVGDRMKIRGEEAEVKHVEYNPDGTHNLIMQRSSQTDSGSYSVKVEPEDKGKRRQRIGAIKKISS